MKIEKFQKICLTLFAISIFSLVALQYTFHQNNMEGSKGILLYQPTENVKQFLLPLLQQEGITTVIQEDGEVTEGLDLLTQQYQVTDTLVVGNDNTVHAVFPCDIPPTYSIAGVLLMSPDISIQELIESGVYSCSYLTVAPTLVVQTVVEECNGVELYNLLSGDTIKDNGSPLKAEKGNVSLSVTSGSVIMAMPYSTATAQVILDFISTQLELPLSLPFYYWGVVLFSSTLLLSLIGGLIILLKKSQLQSEQTGWQVVTYNITHNWKLYGSRLLLVVSAFLGSCIFIGVLILCNSAANLLWAFFLFYLWSLAAITVVLYKKEWMWGVNGVPSFAQQKLSLSQCGKFFSIVAIILVTSGLLGLVGVFQFTLAEKNFIALFPLVFLSTIPYLALSYEYNVVQDILFTLWQRYIFMLLPFLPLVGVIIFGIPLGWITVSFALLRFTLVLIIGGFVARIGENITNSLPLGVLSSGILVGLYLFTAVYGG